MSAQITAASSREMAADRAAEVAAGGARTSAPAARAQRAGRRRPGVLRRSARPRYCHCGEPAGVAGARIIQDVNWAIEVCR